MNVALIQITESMLHQIIINVFFVTRHYLLKNLLNGITMTDQITQEEQTRTQEVNNVLAISYEGNSVNVQIKQGLTMWEALGLLKTAEQIVIAKYNSTLTTSE